MSHRKCPHLGADRYKSGQCKLCARERAKRAYAANPELYKNIRRKYYERNTDVVKARAHAQQLSKLPAPTRAKPTHCECCGKLPGKKALALDHCHITDVFRGWLCMLCNVGIGALGDSLEGLANAEKYLRKVYQ